MFRFVKVNRFLNLDWGIELKIIKDFSFFVFLCIFNVKEIFLEICIIW